GRHAAGRRARHGGGAAAPGAARTPQRCQPRDQRRPPGLGIARRQRPRHAGRAAHAHGGRPQRGHGRHDGAHRRLPRRGALALGGLVHAAVRADPDGADRAGDRRDRDPHVHADLRAGGQPAMIDATEIAAARAAAGGRRLVDVLEERLALGADEFAARLAATFRLEPLRMDELRRLDPAFDLVPFAECSQKGCVALRDPAQGLLLATDDPFSAEQEAWAAERLREPFAWRLVYRGDLVAYLASHEETLRALDSLREEAVAGGESERAVEDLSLKSISDETSEVVRLVRSTLRDALKIGASDIHLESLPSGLAIKFRIDGILSQIKLIEDRAQAEQAIARVKVLAELDITERRIPQDGRFKAAERGRAVDFRVSIMPSIHGEDAVLRILDKQSLYETTQQQLSLGSLGFEERDIRVLRRLSREPYGMLLVTGPTGSGKTTTLYAAISEINSGQDKIVTIEDPVEYQLAGVLQIPVNEKKGLTFARGLRSILRHDPDKIMVGEIRDPETANIAVQSALTGHLVFTT